MYLKSGAVQRHGRYPFLPRIVDLSRHCVCRFLTFVFVSHPGKPNFEAAKRIFRYFNKTKESFWFTHQPLVSLPNMQKIPLNKLWGYVDSDWLGPPGCPDSRQSFSGIVFMLNGAAISWHYKPQSSRPVLGWSRIHLCLCYGPGVDLSPQIPKNLGYLQTAPTPVFADNGSELPGQKAPLAAASVPNMSICVFTLFMRLEQLVIYSYARWIVN